MATPNRNTFNVNPFTAPATRPTKPAPKPMLPPPRGETPNVLPPITPNRATPAPVVPQAQPATAPISPFTGQPTRAPIPTTPVSQYGQQTGIMKPAAPMPTQAPAQQQPAPSPSIPTQTPAAPKPAQSPFTPTPATGNTGITKPATNPTPFEGGANTPKNTPTTPTTPQDHAARVGKLSGKHKQAWDGLDHQNDVQGWNDAAFGDYLDAHTRGSEQVSVDGVAMPAHHAAKAIRDHMDAKKGQMSKDRLALDQFGMPLNKAQKQKTGISSDTYDPAAYADHIAKKQAAGAARTGTQLAPNQQVTQGQGGANPDSNFTAHDNTGNTGATGGGKVVTGQGGKKGTGGATSGANASGNPNAANNQGNPNNQANQDGNGKPSDPPSQTNFKQWRQFYNDRIKALIAKGGSADKIARLQRKLADLVAQFGGRGRGGGGGNDTPAADDEKTKKRVMGRRYEGKGYGGKARNPFDTGNSMQSSFEAMTRLPRG